MNPSSDLIYGQSQILLEASKVYLIVIDVLNVKRVNPTVWEVVFEKAVMVATGVDI